MVPSSAPDGRPACIYDVTVAPDVVHITVRIPASGPDGTQGIHRFAAPLTLDTTDPNINASVDGSLLRLGDTVSASDAHRATVSHPAVSTPTPVDDLECYTLHFESPAARSLIRVQTERPLVATDCQSRVPYRTTKDDESVTCSGAGAVTLTVTVGSADAVNGTLRNDDNRLIFDANNSSVPYVTLPSDRYGAWFGTATPVARLGGLAYLDGGVVDDGTPYRHSVWSTVREPQGSTPLADRDDDGQYIILDSDLAAALARPTGTQVKLTPNDGHSALFTVAAVTDQPGVTVRLTDAGRERLAVAEGPFGAYISPLIAEPHLSREQARRHGEYTERLFGVGDTLIACAPHGGDIEVNTDLQTMRLTGRLPSVETMAWTCEGWDSTGNAFDRFHVTSTDIHPASYPLLSYISDRGFKHAVSFHCHDGDGIVVGGRAPESLRQAVGDALDNAVGDDVDICYTGEYLGQSSDNFVNWLTTDGESGLQLEQSVSVVQNRWRDVADAVAGCLHDWL